MKEVLAYLATLSPADREAFAARCGTTVGYLRKIASTGQRIGERIAIAIDRESNRAVLMDDLRPDADWAYVRRTSNKPKQPATLDGQAVGAIDLQGV